MKYVLEKTKYYKCYIRDDTNFLCGHLSRDNIIIFNTPIHIDDLQKLLRQLIEMKNAQA